MQSLCSSRGSQPGPFERVIAEVARDADPRLENVRGGAVRIASAIAAFRTCWGPERRALDLNRAAGDEIKSWLKFSRLNDVRAELENKFGPLLTPLLLPEAEGARQELRAGIGCGPDAVRFAAGAVLLSK